MQAKCSKKNVCNSAKSSSSQDLVYQHMSNHYRRILNAKKTIDTSPPYCYKPRRPNTVKRQTSAPPSRSKTLGRKKIESSRNTSPVLTDRSISTNSYKESFWGTESVVGSSRYHAACVRSYTGSAPPQPPPPPPPPPKNTFFNMDLINRITYDTKHGPSAYCDETWTGVKSYRLRQTDKTYKNPTTVCTKSKKSSMNPTRSPPSRENDSKPKRKFSSQSKLTSSDVMERQSHLFASLHSKFFPRILKTDAVSKLRSLRVYYPPRRKERRDRRMTEETATEMPLKCVLDSAKCKCTKICVCDETEETLNLKKNPDNPKEQSQTSSRDSAYNGGVSSLPESRSPTPDQRRKKECGCIVEDDSFFCKKKSSDVKIREESKDVKNFRDCHCGRNDSPRGDSSGSDLTTKSKPEDEDSLGKLKDDALYIKFIQDITVEVLEKSLYTNKALKRVMKRHLINNLQTLDKDRMIKELENLRIQLGIPEDDKFFDTIESDSVENVESFTELLKPFPVISDSAFVLPKQDGETCETKKKEDAKTLGGEVSQKTDNHKDQNNSKFDKSKINFLEEIDADSFESDSEDDEELISVVQMTKAMREKRKEKSNKMAKTKGSSNERDSSGESDESVKCKSKSKYQKVKCRKCSCRVSSDSDGAEDKRKKGTVKTRSTKNKNDEDCYDCDSSSSVHLFSYEKLKTTQTTVLSKQCTT